MDRTISTARLMTQEELAAAGLPSAVEGSQERNLMEPGSQEEGEIRSGEESGSEKDISNVEVSIDELIAPNASYPPTLVFGKSLTTPELIKGYEEERFFPAGHGHAPTTEQTPSPRADEVVVFRDFL